MTPREVAIVGAGPAGVAAAVQLARCGLTPSLYERGRVGGLLWNANLLENYPGFPAGVSGADLSARLEEQLARHDVAVRSEEVTAASFDGDAFRLECAGSSERCRLLVVASGTRPRKLPAPPAAPPAGDSRGRVLYDVYPVAGVSGKNIVVVGAGDAAFDYALNLSRRNDVTILGRSAVPRCIPVLEERAAAAARIEYRPNADVLRLDVNDDPGVSVTYAGPDGPESLEADYVLLAIGREPERGFIPESLMEDAERSEGEGRLYFVGDVRNGELRQAAIAAGDGVRAALEIYRYMKKELR
jgi:thioredoxin reductase (NADPH)